MEESLNNVSVIPMCNINGEVISNLRDDPVPSGDLTTQQFKAAFDQTGIAIIGYINNDLISKIQGRINCKGILYATGFGGMRVARPGEDYQEPITSITTSMLDDGSVTKAKLAPDVIIPDKSSAKTAKLTSAGWSEALEQTVTVEGVKADNNIIVTFDPASRTLWLDNGVYALSQTEGSITFKCESKPNSDITANILIVG